MRADAIFPDLIQFKDPVCEVFKEVCLTVCFIFKEKSGIAMQNGPMPIPVYVRTDQRVRKINCVYFKHFR